MKTIGVDLDDVLLNFVDTFLDYSAVRYGSTLKREHTVFLDLERVWQINRDEVDKRLYDFHHSDEHKNAKPIDGAIEAIRELAKENELYIVTASPEEIKEEINMWLDKHFEGIFKSIHFTKKSIFDKSFKMKSEICRELGIEFFIDDSLPNAENISSLNIPVFLFDTPWNQGEVGPLITRVYSWDEILKKLI